MAAASERENRPCPAHSSSLPAIASSRIDVLYGFILSVRYTRCCAKLQGMVRPWEAAAVMASSMIESTSDRRAWLAMISLVSASSKADNELKGKFHKI